MSMHVTKAESTGTVRTAADALIKIYVRWDSDKSIRRAEKDKAALENKGYTLINTFGGMNESVLIYAKGKK